MNFNKLSLSEKEQFYDQTSSLEEVLFSKTEKTILENRLVAPPCPHCKNKGVKIGKTSKGSQRYRCKSCHKYYSNSNGTALHYIKKKHLWGEYINLMLQGYSIRSCSKELGISLQTSFDWRHKVLASLKEHLPNELEGVIECDEMIMKQSEKGNKSLERTSRKRGSKAIKNKKDSINVIVALSRNKQGFSAITEGRNMNAKQATKALKGVLTQGSVLVTDENNVYKKVAKNQGNIVHKTIKSTDNQTRKPKNGVHIQTVNQKHKQIRDFLRPFNGVSTKYLDNYLNWFWIKQQLPSNKELLEKMYFFIIISSSTLFYLDDLIKLNTLIRT